MQTIPCGFNALAQVDDNDYDRLSGHKWTTSPSRHTTYAVAKGVQMHRMVLQVSKTLVVHHKNGDGLDNRKENLEVMTSERHKSVHGQSRGFSRFRGVTRGGKDGGWEAYIVDRKVRRSLGIYKTELIAAGVHDVTARLLHGDEAILNFPEADLLSSLKLEVDEE